MIKQVSKFEIKINEKSYELFCESDSAISDCKEALFQFLKLIGQIEDNNIAMAESLKEEQGKQNNEAA